MNSKLQTKRSNLRTRKITKKTSNLLSDSEGMDRIDLNLDNPEKSPSRVTFFCKNSKISKAKPRVKLTTQHNDSD